MEASGHEIADDADGRLLAAWATLWQVRGWVAAQAVGASVVHHPHAQLLNALRQAADGLAEYTREHTAASRPGSWLRRHQRLIAFGLIWLSGFLFGIVWSHVVG